MLSNLRAIAFDLDNTLWDVEPVLERAEERLIDWLRENCPRIPERVTREDMRAAREQLARDEPERAHDFTYLRTVALARHARECGYEEEIAAQAFDVFFRARNELDLFDDVRPAVERLKSRYSLATLSNGNADLTLIGLAQVFPVSLNARQIGAAKPDRRCFEHLCAALSLEPEAVLYVGDDPWLDVEAARTAGLRTAWMNRCRREWPDGIGDPDLAVGDCHALADALGCA
jgi:FMN hydrolase / 5-amino-6-(5-phospho-D-ribitylamino)uracil phosphatase